MFKVDTYATHLPILAWAARQNRFHVPLEYGSGFYSTAIIQSLRGESVEPDGLWCKQLQTIYPRIIHINDWEPKKQYSFILVDSSPEETRSEFVKKYQHLSTLWILHDAVSDWEHIYRYEPLKRLFNYNKTVGQFPQTLILSQTEINI